MPELPDITVYLEALEERILDRKLEKLRLVSPFLLRTAVPPIREVEGRKVVGLRRLGKRIVMAHPAYDQCIKASHLFNLLDARGVISVTERQAYIGRVRALAKKCADAFVQTEAGGHAA